jgi:signal transduction histidine kinase
MSSARHGKRGYRIGGSGGAAYRRRGTGGCRARRTAHPGRALIVKGVNIAGHLRYAARRHPHFADAMIALAVFAATVLTTFAGHQALTVRSRDAALAAAVLACGSLALRRRRPLPMLAVSAVAGEMFLAQFTGAGGVLILLAPAIALYTVAELVERQTSMLVGGAVLAAFALAHALMHPAMLGTENLAFTALGALAFAAGDSSRNRRAYLHEVEQRAERAEADRERDARRRVAEERLRIARDLHDSVGHHLAVISVQSDVAVRAIALDGAGASEALGHVKTASRKALGELRDTISLLREADDPVAPTAIPAPGLDALEDLLGTLRDSGMRIDVQIEGTPVPLAPAADLTAYRVIQEALTNVYKHSRQRRARLGLCYGRNEVRITVDDLGGGLAAITAVEAPAAAGHGIVGMQERIQAIGGRFTAEARAAGAFHVAAALPYRPLAPAIAEPA